MERAHQVLPPNLSFGSETGQQREIVGLIRAHRVALRNMRVAVRAEPRAQRRRDDQPLQAPFPFELSTGVSR